MWHDPIIEELQQIREEHAKKFHYDLTAIFEDLKKAQAKETSRKIISTPFKLRKPLVSQPSKHCH